MNILILLHSLTRYLVLIALLGVIILSLIGLLQSKPFARLENKASLWLFIFTHVQFTLGLILYVTSPLVIFSGASMKNAHTRYWLVEHSSMMILAIILITMARITAKKLPTDVAKHKRLLIFNSIALILILVGISMSGRGFFGLPS